MDNKKRDLALLLQPGADFTFLAFSVDYSTQELAQEAELSPSLHQHTQYNSQKYSSLSPTLSQKIFVSNCVKPEQLETQKASLVLSPAIANLCHKLINTALSGV